MMEGWNNGNRIKRSFFAYIIPTFQYSTIPLWWKRESVFTDD